MENLESISRAYEPYLSADWAHARSGLQARPARASSADAGTDHAPARSTLLASLSHELRTPLNSLLMLARLLGENEGGRLTPKQIEYAKTIHAAGEELLSLVTDVVDLCRIQAGELPICRRNVALADFADYLNATFQAAASRRGIALQVRLAPQAPRVLCTDAQRLQQVLRNLLAHVLKFTDRGELIVEIGCAPGEPRAVLFAIRNTAMAAAEPVFQTLEPANGAAKVHGSALGLALSRALVQLLGGTIEAPSMAGAGSAITIRLPGGDAMEDALERAARRRPLARGAAASREERHDALLPSIDPRLIENIAGRRVLVMQDDVRNLFALACLLERCRADVVTASDAPEALAALAQGPTVDLVMMDDVLAGTDAHEAVRSIRAAPGYAAVPIIALTAGTGNSEAARRCSASLAKPLDTAALLQTLEQVFPH